MRLEDLGLVGNCQIAALIENTGSIVWCCLPRFDSEPVFSALLDEGEGGRFSIGPADGSAGRQRYVENTNILETVFRTPDGAFRLVDFAPRFEEHARYFRPTQLFRIVEPLEGAPRIVARCAPKIGWSKSEPGRSHGSHHVDFHGFEGALRLTTDVPLSYLGGDPFVLAEKRYFALTWGPPVEEPLPALADRFVAETTRYWQRWVKHCTTPPFFQSEVIRSALALKLHCYEDTGAIVAAMTTSIPEAQGSGRTWDYRYCWLRDSYYVLGALGLLGHFEERESFVQFLLNVAGSADDLKLAPLYRVDGKSDLEERVLGDWPGFRGNGPVRVGNGAAKHEQHDVFGEMVLALTPIFLDDRFSAERTTAVMKLLQKLTRTAIGVAGKPDAGIWEYRTEWKPQTFSTLMCWAAADRMATVAKRHAPSEIQEFLGAAASLRETILREAYAPSLRAFAGTHGGTDLDASLLQMAPLRFLPPGDPHLVSTVEVIGEGLSHDGWLFRYGLDDGFGKPVVAFVICTFWYAEALALMGRVTEAGAVMGRVISTMSPLGLLAEDCEAAGPRMWGNFPQAYSHVGLIHSAFAASPPWRDVL